MTDIAVIGAGIAGGLAAAYLKKKFPDMKITVISRRDRPRPIVGESLIEASTHLIQEIGLGPLLVEKHYPKYGLTYYYKARLHDPADRTYIVDESPLIPPLPSFQLNRFTFDEDLLKHCEALGVEFIDADATEVEIGEAGAHRLTAKEKAGVLSSLEARWIVDASGRGRFLSRKLGLEEKTPYQRHTFWFRLVDYDPALLARIDAIKKENRSFQPYYCTHHFFGKGNWIWVIPMRSDEHASMASIGIVWRPDLNPIEITSMEEFLDYVSSEHAVLADLVRNGRVIDTNQYRNYMYRAKQRYSTQGWFLVGDAADSVDPLYSLGLAIVSFQVEQVGEMIRRDIEGTNSQEFARDLDRAIEGFHHTAQDGISHLYSVMEDPFQCHLRMHIAILSAFRFPLPLMQSGYICDPVGAKILGKLGEPQVFAKELDRFNQLIKEAARQVKEFAPENFIKVVTAFSLNIKWQEYQREEELAETVAAGLFYLARFRLRLLSKLGWRAFLRFGDQATILRDCVRGLLMWLLFKGKPLRRSHLIRLLVGR